MTLIQVYRPRRRFRSLALRWVGWRGIPFAAAHDRFPEGDSYRLWLGGLLFVVRIAKP